MPFFGYSQSQVDALLAAKDIVIAAREAEIVTLKASNAAIQRELDEAKVTLDSSIPVDPTTLPQSVRQALVRTVAGRGQRQQRAAFAKAQRVWSELQAKGMPLEQAEMNLVNDILKGDDGSMDEFGNVKGLYS